MVEFLLLNPVNLHLLTQGAAAQSEALSGFGLVVFAMFEDGLDQWLFYFAQHQFVEVAGAMAIQPRKIRAKRLSYMAAEDGIALF